MHRLVPALILTAVLSGGIQAGEIELANVANRDGEYRVDITARIQGNKDRIYQIATEPETQTRLNHMIIESVLVHPTGTRSTTPVHRIVSRACRILF